MQVDSYTLIEQDSKLSLKFLFISEGNDLFVKAIEYAYVNSLHGNKIYNLAFGDYNIQEDKIDDLVDTNNGDGRKVLRTVLGTIPKFFKRFPNDVLMISGSDSKKEYLDLCLQTCIKHCTDAESCKNKDRRISVYRNYVNLNYMNLSENYAFFGGLMNNSTIQIVPYIPNSKYNTVFVIKK